MTVLNFRKIKGFLMTFVLINTILMMTSFMFQYFTRYYRIDKFSQSQTVKLQLNYETN